MKFSEVLRPGLERVRALKDCTVGGVSLKAGQTAELPSDEAHRAVRQRSVKYATRVELLEHIGPFGEQGIEPGVGSVLEMSSHQALAMERNGTGRPAKPIDGKPSFPVDSGPMVKLRVKPVKAHPHAPKAGAKPSLFVGPLMASFVAGDVLELPEDLARPYITGGLLEPIDGPKLPERAAS